MENSQVIKIILSSVSTFIVGILITPFISDFLYKNKLWKKKSTDIAIGGKSAEITSLLHNDEERKTPRMGGVVVWVSVLITTAILVLLNIIWPESIFKNTSFFDRGQTWIPVTVLLIMSIVGLVDDYLVCRESETSKGLSIKTRVSIVALSGLIIAFWFYFKIDITTIHVPFMGELLLSPLIFFIFFIFVMVATYSSGIIDGIDGLSGGIFAILFAGYGIISFSMDMLNLASFCFSITGGLTAFLWFNIPPARFFLSDTGSMGLTTTLAVVSFFTNTILFLPIIAFPLVITVLSDIIQIASKKFRNGKKVFLVAPLHNHFQVLGWSQPKIVMRYWLITLISTLIGVALVLMDKTF